MTKAIVVRSTGGPEVLQLEEISVGDPGPGEIKLHQSAIGVNFVDTYYRSGLYQAPRAPGLPEGAFIPGDEAVGIVAAVGADVSGLKEGDRVAYGNGPSGAYAQERLIPAVSVVKVPAGLQDEQVAGMLLRGLTVWYLIRALHVLKEGETVLVHAVAGGVGLILCQWAKHLGATVIGTVGGPEKVTTAKAAGCDHVILYRSEDWVSKVRAITGGKGVPVVYDGVGRDTFLGGLDCLATRGTMVTFGNASGPVAPMEPRLLAAKGSLFLTRPTLSDYIAERADYERAVKELFEVVLAGAVKIDVGQAYPLDQARRAHEDLEGRRTRGSTILTV